ncbi:MAG: hypothetical protein KGK07_07165 [Chloroflexota bacterium]|nr:hypothetical protein [Chloroflexota bacterium]
MGQGMSGTVSSNLLPSAIASALSRAYPNPLPANQVITQVADGDASVNVSDAVTTTLKPLANLVWGDYAHATDSAWSAGGQWQGVVPGEGGLALSGALATAQPGEAALGTYSPGS